MIAQYQGLNVNELDALRKSSGIKESYLKLQKINSKIAIKETPKNEKYFTGPTAAAISSILFQLQKF